MFIHGFFPERECRTRTITLVIVRWSRIFGTSRPSLGVQVLALVSFISFPNVVTGEHWTGSPNQSIDQIGKKCPKNVRKLCFRPLRTIFGHFSDIFFGHFSDILSTFPFRSCPMICPLQFPNEYRSSKNVWQKAWKSQTSF